MDPIGLLCPQRMIDPPRMDDTTLMRHNPRHSVIHIHTALDWSAWNVQAHALTGEVGAPGSGGDPAGGLAKAVDMCNNNGHCRKFDAGTMCPSYRITRDEQHLTRGRANTLRLALSGQLGTDALTGERVREALDLCVSCKGCKRDCPTGVDMARMKIEATHQYKQYNGQTWRDRLVAHLPDYARHAAAFSELLNLRDRLPGLAWLSEKCVGLSAKRSLPVWQRHHFFKRSTLGVSASEVLKASRPVVLWVDTFNGHFEPGNALAAFRV